MTSSPFKSFSPDLVRFLDDLSAHNDRDWFKRNKPRYEQDVLEPALAFVDAMAKPLAKFAPHFRAVASRTGGSVMRIYRDTRFSKDKSPYKTNLGIQFRHERGRDVHAPGFYFHVDPQQVFVAAGLWHPDSVALRDIRSAIADSPDVWQKARDSRPLARRFRLAGDTLKRPPKGFAADHPMIGDLKRKDFIAVADLAHEDLYREDMVANISRYYRSATPLMEFLCAAPGAPF
ncbi:MAG: DUF2461 domain-containing protein [Deltaproteobacteria bacterium]|jgi:uncharacterized protein (TIGR02453 family)|nr:DUF2461 domain-containing protein [Deltaproteobacteria bacterium]